MPNHRPSPWRQRLLVAAGAFTFASWTLLAAVFLAWAPARATAQRTWSRVAAAWPATGAQPAWAHHHAPAQAIAPLAGRIGSAAWLASAGHGFSYGTEHEGFSWSLLEEDGRGLWRFRLDGVAYEVRDPALVAEAERATKELGEIGAEMGLLGGEMGRHGAAMGELGGRLGAASGRLAAIQARLVAREGSRGADADTRAELEAVRGEMEQLREQASAQRREHVARRQEYSRRMAEAAARHREALQEARTKLRELARRALREGKAERPHANA